MSSIRFAWLGLLVQLPGLLVIDSLAAGHPPGPAAREKPRIAATNLGELTGTLRMLGGHATLRTPEVADPDSDANQLALELMLRKTLSRAAQPRQTVTIARVPLAEIVGTLEGEFSVNNHGNANYELTLPLPDSRGYFQPTLQLYYSSANGDGVLGRGFSLSTGFYHSIVRGRTILARDGVVRSKELGDRDFFYLDGKRLICTCDHAVHGRPGCVYRTEVDSFVTIQAEGENERIDRFVLTNQYGRRSIFGQHGESTDALHRGFDETRDALDPVPYAYALKRVEDGWGDFVAFEYEHAGHGEWVLKHIDYAGGNDISAPFRIRCHYAATANAAAQYAALRRFDDVQLLERIDVVALANDQVVAKYEFGYEGGAARPHKRLTSVSALLAADVGAPLRSLPPTTFGWFQQPAEGGRLVPLRTPLESAASDGRMLFAVGDFDGDSRTDVADARTGLRILRSTPDSPAGKSAEWMEERSLTAVPAGRRHIIPGDFDGDHRTDLLVVSPEGKALVAVSTGASFRKLCTLDLPMRSNPALPGGAPAQLLSRCTVGDFNGDGRDDLLVHTVEGQLRVLLSNGSALLPPDRSAGAAASATVAPVSPFPSDAGAAPADAEVVQAFAVDVNGDGLSDYAWLDVFPIESGSPGPPSGAADHLRAAFRYVVALPEGGFSAPGLLFQRTWRVPRGPDPSQSSEDPPWVQPGDYNGDGLADFLVGAASEAAAPGSWTVFLSRGHPTNFARSTPDMFRRVDAAIQPGLETRLTPADRATAESLTSPAAIGRALLAAAVRRECLVTDFDDDGRDDFACYEPATRGAPAGAASPHSGWRLYRAKGDGSFHPSEPLDGSPWSELCGVRPDSTGGQAAWVQPRPAGDFNTDGVPDWIVVKGSSTGAPTLSAVILGAGSLDGRARPGFVVTDFTNGYGSNLHIGYKSARDDTVYTPGPAVSFPVVAWRPARLVVSEMWKDAGGEIAAQYSYQYADNHIDFSGRGGMGFGAFTTHDRQTGFVKYQFLEKSFPMTGLTRREQTYWHWQQDGKSALKLVSAKEHLVTFDAVRRSEDGKLYGTLHPFVAEWEDRRWQNDARSDYSFALDQLGNPDRRKAVLRVKSPSAPISRTIEREWFDQQPDTIPSRAQPAAALPYPVATNPPFPATDDSLLSTIALSSAALPGNISHGNSRVKETIANGVRTRTVKTYRPPRAPGDSLVSLVSSSAEQAWRDGGWVSSGTRSNYTYFGQSTFYQTETVDTRNAPDDSPREVKLTRYTRDDRGRVLQREVWTDRYDDEEVETSSSVEYQASGYLAELDRPTAEITPKWSRTSLRYHPLWRKLTAASYTDGPKARFEYDGLGRSVLTANDAGYRAETQYRWTTRAGEDWWLVQRVVPPEGCGGLANESVYAERQSETDEPTTTRYYDRTARLIRTVAHAADGIACVDLIYNPLGFLVAQSEPFAPLAEKVTWNIKIYDGYGLVASEHKAEAPGPGAAPTGVADYVQRAARRADRDRDGAIADLGKALELAPDNSRAWLKLAWLRFRKADDSAALAAAERAVELVPELAEAIACRGFMQLKMGNLAAAEADLARAVKLDPASAYPWAWLGDVKVEQKCFEEADVAFTRAITLTPQDDYLWNKRGYARLKREDFDRAIEDLNEAVRIDADSAIHYYWRGVAKLRKNLYAAAIEDFTKTIEIDPKDFTNLRGRANARNLAGDFPGALDDLEQAIALADDDAPYMRFGCFLLRHRLGRPIPPAELEAMTRTKGEWPQTIARFLTKAIDEPALLERAQILNNEDHAVQQCEAFYYAGMVRLLAQDFAGARMRFEQCVAVNVRRQDEQRFAKAELDRMSREPTPE